jgi:hypothetical protein
MALLRRGERCAKRRSGPEDGTWAALNRLRCAELWSSLERSRVSLLSSPGTLDESSQYWLADLIWRYVVSRVCLYRLAISVEHLND